MRHRYVRKNLVPFCEGALEGGLACQMQEHLRACHRCRKEYEQISRGVSLARRLSRPTGPGLSWDELERATRERQNRIDHGTTASPTRLLFPWFRPIVFTAVFSIFVLVGSGLFRYWEHGRVDLDPYLSKVETATSGHTEATILAAAPGFETLAEQAALQAAGVEHMASEPPLTGYRLVQHYVFGTHRGKVVQLGYSNGSESFSVFVAPRKVSFSFGKRQVGPFELDGIQCNEVSCPRTSTVLFTAKRFNCVLVSKSENKRELAAVVRYFLSAHQTWRPL